MPFANNAHALRVLGGVMHKFPPVELTNPAVFFGHTPIDGEFAEAFFADRASRVKARADRNRGCANYPVADGINTFDALLSLLPPTAKGTECSTATPAQHRVALITGVCWT